jgi:hypothetical protein
MNVKIIVSDNFRKEAKPLIKKYPSLKEELFDLEEKLALNPNLGIPIGNNCFKIRLSIKSKGRGKSGGGRVITFIYSEYKKNNIVFLASIYDKSDFENINVTDLKKIISEIHFEYLLDKADKKD